MERKNNIVVNALWIGKTLSPIELLCIHSFLYHGHVFKLWLYDELDTPLPEGVVICDASSVIPQAEVFSYKEANQFSHGKGSYAGFSDLFRYKLLYENGGWWIDMDVICLKPLDFTEPYVFRSHHDFPVIGNIMKCPSGSQVMLDCYNESRLKVTERNKDWNLPVTILNNHIANHKLQQYIKKFSNKDDWHVVKKMIFFSVDTPEQWYAVHMLNEEWRKRRISKNVAGANSFLMQQANKYMPGHLFSHNKWLLFVNYSRAYLITIHSSFYDIKWFVIDSFWWLAKKILGTH